MSMPCQRVLVTLKFNKKWTIIVRNQNKARKKKKSRQKIRPRGDDRQTSCDLPPMDFFRLTKVLPRSAENQISKWTWRLAWAMVELKEFDYLRVCWVIREFPVICKQMSQIGRLHRSLQICTNRSSLIIWTSSNKNMTSLWCAKFLFGFNSHF